MEESKCLFSKVNRHDKQVGGTLNFMLHFRNQLEKTTLKINAKNAVNLISFLTTAKFNVLLKRVKFCLSHQNLDSERLLENMLLHLTTCLHHTQNTNKEPFLYATYPVQ